MKKEKKESNHFTFYSLLFTKYRILLLFTSYFLLILVSCSDSSTKPKSASLTGVISLINDSNDAANELAVLKTI